jgi:hypothetical protein
MDPPVSDTPTLSEGTVALLLDVMGNVQLPVTHPQLEEIAAAWAQAKRELAAIAAQHNPGGQS